MTCTGRYVGVGGGGGGGGYSGKHSKVSENVAEHVHILLKN